MIATNGNSSLQTLEATEPCLQQLPGRMYVQQHAYVYINKSEQMDVYERVRVFVCVVTRKQADITVLRCKRNLPCCA